MTGEDQTFDPLMQSTESPVLSPNVVAFTNSVYEDQTTQNV